MIELRRDAVMRATRSLVVAIALTAALMSALLATATGASAAKLEGPKLVKPGKAVTFRALGIRPNSALHLRIQPASTPKDRIGIDGANVAEDLDGRPFRRDAGGRATMRFRFPKDRTQCGVSCADRGVPWKRGGRIAVELFAGGADEPQARKVVRTRGARRKKAKLRSCGSLVFTPHSGDALARIKARGIGCRAARRKLTAWRRNSYRPVKGPRGYRCDWGPQGPRPAARVHCRRIGASLPVISYTSGT